MKHCCMIFLILQIIVFTSCTSRKKNIANLFHYQIYSNDGSDLDSSKDESRANDQMYRPVNTNRKPHYLEKDRSYNSIMKNLPMYSSYDLSNPIKYEDLQQKSYDIPSNYYFVENVGQNHLDLLKPSNYFDNRIDDDFYHRLSRKKRRIIYLNDKFDPLNYTPKRHVKKNIKETETFEQISNNKIDNNDERNYQVYDTESDVNHEKPNHLWSFIPIEKSSKGHGYLIFGKRYTFYVSVDPMKKSKSSSTSEEKLVESEDDLREENNINNVQKEGKTL